jgi:hypothetical protein
LLNDATRPSRVKSLSPEKVKQVVHMTLHDWSLRRMAAAAGISYSGLPMKKGRALTTKRSNYSAARLADPVSEESRSMWQSRWVSSPALPAELPPGRRGPNSRMD